MGCFQGFPGAAVSIATVSVKNSPQNLMLAATRIVPRYEKKNVHQPSSLNETPFGKTKNLTVTSDGAQHTVSLVAQNSIPRQTFAGFN